MPIPLVTINSLVLLRVLKQSIEPHSSAKGRTMSITAGRFSIERIRKLTSTLLFFRTLKRLINSTACIIDTIAVRPKRQRPVQSRCRLAKYRNSNPKIDMAIGKYDKMVDYLRQGIFENYDWRTSLDELQQIMEV